jgi:hypothetical protein
MRQLKWSLGLALVALTASLFGCGGDEVRARVDRTGAQATTTRPVSTEVPLESIPYDSRQPKYVVVVEPPFPYAASGASAGVGASGTTVLDLGGQVSLGVPAQLVSALNRVGNVILVDWADYQAQGGQIKLQPGEIGPFIIRGAVTECQEKSDESTSGEVKGPSFWTYLIPHVGGIIAAGVGTKSETQTRMEGMIAIDLRVVDSRSKRVIASFPAAGSFVTFGATKSRTSFNTTRTSVEYASSAIGQAERQAMNNAIHGIHNCLARQAPPAPATQMAEAPP